MMTLIRAKDQQLEEALDQLNKMKIVQQKLIEESKQITDQADDYADRMRALLHAKEQDVDIVVRQLEQLKMGEVLIVYNTFEHLYTKVSIYSGMNQIWARNYNASLNLSKT